MHVTSSLFRLMSRDVLTPVRRHLVGLLHARMSGAATTVGRKSSGSRIEVTLDRVCARPGSYSLVSRSRPADQKRPTAYLMLYEASPRIDFSAASRLAKRVRFQVNSRVRVRRRERHPAHDVAAGGRLASRVRTHVPFRSSLCISCVSPCLRGENTASTIHHRDTEMSQRDTE